MGKQSKLRNPQPDGTRHAYTNGDRKLIDKDKGPAGVDEHVWSLALYFEQLAEENGYNTPGRPVLYTELYHRVSKDADLSGLLDVSSNSACCGIAGTTALDILEDMIQLYWDREYINISKDSKYSVSDFCSLTVFDYHKHYVVDTKKRQILLTTGSRVTQQEREIKPSRKTEEERETAIIKQKKYSEEELSGKFRKFKEGS